MDLSDVKQFQTLSSSVILKSTDAFGEIVAFEITFPGTVTLPPTSGLLEWLTHTITHGTKSYTKEQIDQIFAEKGAVFGIDARPDAIEVSLKCLKKFLPDLLPIISEMLTAPLLEEKELKITKTQMTAALRGEEERPDSLMQLVMHQAFYKDHPYFNRPNGYLDSLEALKRSSALELLPKIFNQENALFVVIGSLSSEETQKLITQYFAPLPHGTKAAKVTAQPKNPAGEVLFRKMESPTSYFLAKFKAPSLMDEDYPALVLITQILDNRLFEEVRTKRALTYAVSSGLGNSGVNSGYLYVSSTNLPEATQVMFKEVQKIQTELVDSQSLELQVRKFTSTWYLGREQSSNQASILALYETIGKGWANANTFINRLEKVTPEKMREVAKKYYRDFTYAVVGPEAPKLDFLPK